MIGEGEVYIAAEVTTDEPRVFMIYSHINHSAPTHDGSTVLLGSVAYKVVSYHAAG